MKFKMLECKSVETSTELNMKLTKSEYEGHVDDIYLGVIRNRLW